MSSPGAEHLSQRPDFREFVDNIENVAVWTGDEDGFNYISSGYETIFGRPVEQLYEGGFDILLEDVHPDDIDRVERAIEDPNDALAQGHPDSFEHRVVRPDGETRWVEVRIFPVHDDAGNLAEVAGVTIDITERKRAELDLQRQKERLERFTSVVSHDLRNPLNVASGRLDLLEEAADLDDAAEAELAAVKRAHDRMERIVEDLLWLAQEGRDIGARTTVSLERVVRDAWQHVNTGAATLVTDCDVRLSADDDRLQQLFENLIRNSVEHGTTPDTDAPTVRVGILDGGDGFYVEDDGPGIPADVRDAVLIPGHTSTAEGSGFGLAIVATIAAAHGWELDVTESDEGGARFEFSDVALD